MDHEEYLKRVKSYIKTPTKDMEQQLQEFCKICTYVSGQYDKDESFIELRKHLEELEKSRKEANRVFYMALPPSVFTTVSQHLKKNCYPKSGLARIIVRGEIPFTSIPVLTNHIGREAIWKGSHQFPRVAKGVGAKLE
jgi:glucose-6-phosphate 1-dehydrogenase